MLKNISEGDANMKKAGGLVMAFLFCFCLAESKAWGLTEKQNKPELKNKVERVAPEKFHIPLTIKEVKKLTNKKELMSNLKGKVSTKKEMFTAAFHDKIVKPPTFKNNKHGRHESTLS